MNRHTLRLIPFLAGALALAACSDHATKPAPTTTRTVTTTATPATGGTKSTGSTSTTTTRTTTRTSVKDAPLPESTGIPSCDEYLASYKTCHLAAGIYARDQIDTRYDMMRTSLLKQSQDPDMRDQLGNRCTSLANQLKEALHGKSCADVPAPASTR